MVNKNVVIGFVVLFIFCAFPNFMWLFDLGHPAHNSFDIDWPEIQKVQKNDTVSNGLAMVFVFSSVVVYSVLFSLASCCFLKANFLTTLVLAVIAFEFCFGVCGVFTGTLKYSVARFRPYFLQVCAPDMIEVNKIRNEQESKFGYHFAADFPCTGKEKEVNEARRSFPSGHSAMSFCATFFCSFLCFRYAFKFDLYFHMKRKKIEGSAAEEGASGSGSASSGEGEGGEEEYPPFYHTRSFYYVVATFLSLPAVVIALFIAGSRVTDNKHNLSDVIAGMFVGVLSGAASMFVLILGEYEELRRAKKEAAAKDKAGS